MKKNYQKPILRWAGGKTQILCYLIKNLPKNIDELRYVEPFFGAGSLFFSLKPSKSIISDINEDLISCYRCICKKPLLIHRHLGYHAKNDSESYYYKIREQYNKHNHLSAAQAARFIYLNKTSYNGIFRVNKSGKYNVPYGHRKFLGIPSLQDLKDASSLLKRARIKNNSYDIIFETLNDKDFIYLDPPYPPLNGTSYFTHYTKERFSLEDHLNLAGELKNLDRAGIKFMVSNADTPSIKKMYRQFNIKSLPVIRYITCKKKKHTVKELIIKNY